ncbi:MAG: thiol:disulfide interchange protein DsbA/DsbL [Pseudomonadota bacterium]
MQPSTLARLFPLAGRAAAALFAFLFTVNVSAQDMSIEGKYEKISAPQATTDPDKVEVVEVFWYGCPHCNAFQPHLHPWVDQLADDVAFVRMPAIFRDSWEPHARAYYSANALNALDQTHTQIFDAIHRKGRALTSKKSIRAFFAEQGVAEDEFEKYYDSFGVDSEIRRSKVMVARYGIRGVPAVIVNGKYRVSASMAGGYGNMLKVVDALIEIERNATKK